MCPVPSSSSSSSSSSSGTVPGTGGAPHPGSHVLVQARVEVTASLALLCGGRGGGGVGGGAWWVTLQELRPPAPAGDAVPPGPDPVLMERRVRPGFGKLGEGCRQQPGDLPRPSLQQQLRTGLATAAFLIPREGQRAGDRWRRDEVVLRAALVEGGGGRKRRTAAARLVAIPARAAGLQGGDPVRRVSLSGTASGGPKSAPEPEPEPEPEPGLAAVGAGAGASVPSPRPAGLALLAGLLLWAGCCCSASSSRAGADADADADADAADDSGAEADADAGAACGAVQSPPSTVRRVLPDEAVLPFLARGDFRGSGSREEGGKERWRPAGGEELPGEGGEDELPGPSGEQSPDPLLPDLSGTSTSTSHRSWSWSEGGKTHEVLTQFSPCQASPIWEGSASPDEGSIGGEGARRAATGAQGGNPSPSGLPQGTKETSFGGPDSTGLDAASDEATIEMGRNPEAPRLTPQDVPISPDPISPDKSASPHTNEKASLAGSEGHQVPSALLESTLVCDGGHQGERKGPEATKMMAPNEKNAPPVEINLAHTATSKRDIMSLSTSPRAIKIYAEASHQHNQSLLPSPTGSTSSTVCAKAGLTVNGDAAHGPRGPPRRPRSTHTITNTRGSFSPPPGVSLKAVDQNTAKKKEKKTRVARKLETKPVPAVNRKDLDSYVHSLAPVWELGGASNEGGIGVEGETIDSSETKSSHDSSSLAKKSGESTERKAESPRVMALSNEEAQIAGSKLIVSKRVLKKRVAPEEGSESSTEKKQRRVNKQTLARS